ncbi:TIGR03862 family flavoprotein [Spongiibacter sp. KMU-158]|uniref:TIGR03862 family flavoprotein n=1 Tax=Spongiibacter pelagi TaxID=2760804 RepID=A0A927C4S0_9GAMM|nr:TIGR03862 family flavoprotein [Spongiibacter pelagi]MBD2859420.1 TIGR03862 family flavoprotein [Spongiibacter pelagi]
MTISPDPKSPTVAVIGAGPAGLMAAEQLAAKGFRVEVFDAMPSAARKFLRAGVGGMNITHAEDYSQFILRYGDTADALQPFIDALRPDALRQWIHDLGVETFVGTSGRVFPKEMKAAPLLRAWLHRLREQGVVFHQRHRWTGLRTAEHKHHWQFQTPHGQFERSFSGVVLALGGASWPQLGSDGSWAKILEKQGLSIAAFQASNCGFELNWSDYLKKRFAGTPLKNIQLNLKKADGSRESRIGECLISEYGIEGSLIYALSASIRDQLQQTGAAQLSLDWLPQNSLEQITAKLQSTRKGISTSNLLQKKLKLPAIAHTLLRECCPDLQMSDTASLAQCLKNMQLPPIQATRPIAEAISTAGGISFSELSPALMLEKLPGVFVAGEMLDWEAPTGGYLLTACFATGQAAGQGLANWLNGQA